MRDDLFRSGFFVRPSILSAEEIVAVTEQVCVFVCLCSAGGAARGEDWTVHASDSTTWLSQTNHLHAFPPSLLTDLAP